MYWTIDEKVFTIPLSLLHYASFNIYSAVDVEEENNLVEDIKNRGQVTNIYIADDNLVIGGARICKALKAAGMTYAKAQRVKIKPEFYQLFYISSNKYRQKTKLDSYREVEIVLATISRHQGKKTSKTFEPGELSKQIQLPPTPNVIIPVNTKAIQAKSGIPEGQTKTEPSTLPEQSIVPLPRANANISKSKSPVQQAVEAADNGMNTTEFQRMKFIETVDKKYGTKLLILLDSKCPNVDKVYKAAQTVKERNEKREKGNSILYIPQTMRGNPSIFNKSNRSMSEVKDNSIDFVFTSNSYWDQIEYLNPEKENQLGQEPTIEKFIERLMDSYNEVYKKLAPTGNLFVNYKGTVDKSGNCVGEEEFVIAMRKNGWLYKGRYIWLKKGGGKRSGKRTRNPENCYEPVYWFTKTANYYYRAIEIPNDRPITATFKSAETRVESIGISVYDKIDVSIPFTTFKNVVEETNFLEVVITNSAATDSQFMNDLYGKHPAPFPMALPLLFLLQFCPPNGRVLEPFLGRGAGLISPLMLGHTCYGYEIESEYFEMAKKLLTDVKKDIDFYMKEMNDIKATFDKKFNQAA